MGKGVLWGCEISAQKDAEPNRVKLFGSAGDFAVEKVDEKRGKKEEISGKTTVKREYIETAFQQMLLACPLRNGRQWQRDSGISHCLPVLFCNSILSKNYEGISTQG